MRAIWTCAVFATLGACSEKGDSAAPDASSPSWDAARDDEGADGGTVERGEMPDAARTADADYSAAPLTSVQDAAAVGTPSVSVESATELHTSSATSAPPDQTSPNVTIPGCGDGLIGALEQCDDGNDESGDGCSRLCRVELGSKCAGEPSVCLLTTCGDAIREGAEGCDDGNVVPFDGCSSNCASEPQCEPGAGCHSPCGDGLVVGEECDDGNDVSGDGCSDVCTREVGFSCLSPAGSLPAASMRARAVHRDFSASQPDFGIAAIDNVCGVPEGDPIDDGIVQIDLDAEGKPVLGEPPSRACIESAYSFSQWFRAGVQVVDVMTLYDNTAGAYVNRFGEDGERYGFVQKGLDEQVIPSATSQDTCEDGCRQRETYTLNCYADCEIMIDERASANTSVALLEAERDVTEDPAELEELEAEIAELEAQVSSLSGGIEECESECSAAIEQRVPECVQDCKPCSFSADQTLWCVGGEYIEVDGTPLFFPVDHVEGPTRDVDSAQIPPDFGGVGWPLESDVFGETVEHNFSFTTEVRHWFRYNPDFTLNLVFMSDDDAFVFVNGRLAVDLGGLHVPTQGAVAIGPTTAGDFGLLPGKVYEIAVFKAERKYGGSTLLLSLPASVELGASVCIPE